VITRWAPGRYRISRYRVCSATCSYHRLQVDLRPVRYTVTPHLNFKSHTSYVRTIIPGSPLRESAASLSNNVVELTRNGELRVASRQIIRRIASSPRAGKRERARERGRVQEKKEKEKRERKREREREEGGRTWPSWSVNIGIIKICLSSRSSPL